VGSSFAQQVKKAPVGKVSPVELLALKKGEELKGLSLGKTKSGTILFAVQRSWLKKSFPDKFDAFLKIEKENSDSIKNNYTNRISQWIDESQKENQSKSWINLLQEELKNQQENNLQNQQFYLFEIKPSDVKKYTPLQPLIRQLLLVAWQEKLDNIENSFANDLSVELQKSMIDWYKEKIYLADKLPSMKVEDNVDWSIRKAVFAYKYQAGLHLQGSGDFLVDKDDKKGNNPAALFQGVAKSVLGDAFKELGIAQNQTVQPSWGEQAAKAGNEKKVIAIRVTRVLPEISAGRVNVEDTLLAKMPNGLWSPIWNSKLSGDATLLRPQAEAQIRTDPNVGAMLKQVENLGLGNQLNAALRAGAATLELQAQSDRDFAEFLRLTSKRLDGPPMYWFLK